ncbi:hypothetical protein BaRGS_00016113, partial [Batillaria attramentaria]
AAPPDTVGCVVRVGTMFTHVRSGCHKTTRVCLVWTGHNFAQTYITLCAGSDVNHKLCTLSECPVGTLAYRHWQCLTAGRRLDGLSSSTSSLTWFPAPRGDGRPCGLVCQSSQGWIQNMGTALDGTPCAGNGTRVCIRGLCQSVGCDGVVESRAILDVCGRCTREGVNTTCSLVQGTYTNPYPDTSSGIAGYNFIIQVPKGSTHLYVKEKSKNLIALRDKTGTFIINGQFRSSKNGVYTVAGTDFHYRRLPDGKETLESDGPLTRDAVIFTTLQKMGIASTGEKVHRHSEKTTSFLSDDAIWSFLMGELDKDDKPVWGDKDRTGRTPLPPTSSNTIQPLSPNSTMQTPTTTTAQPCEPCNKMKDGVFHFCDSDFVSQVLINHKAYVGGETRYDVTIFRSYKSRMKLLDREFLWAPNLCNCPRLRPRKSYVIMGFMERHLDRELKLIVTPTAYVRRFSPKQHQRMLKLEERVKC